MDYLLSANDQEDVAVLRDRLYHAQFPSQVTSSIAPPSFPFTRVDVKAAPEVQPQLQSTHAQQDITSQMKSNIGMQQHSQTSNVFNPGSHTPFQAPLSHAPTPTSSYYSGNQPHSLPSVGYQAQGNYGGNFSSPSMVNQPPPTMVNQPPPTMVNQPPRSMVNQPPPTMVNQPPPTMVNQPPPSMVNQPPPSMVNQPPRSMVNQPPSSQFNPQQSFPSYQGPPPPTGAPSQMHSEPPPLTSSWSADGSHVMAKRHQPANFTPPAPITMPIFNAPGEQKPAQTGNSSLPSVVPGGGVPPGAPQGPVQPPPVDSKPEMSREVPKGPIPAEHIPLQESFDGLVAKCRGTAMNQQTKRKLDDVTKKLGALYDKLREQKLSPSILTGLHNIAQACQAADYASGYQAYTSLISSGSFSEISSFMPGIKSLMQIATQLRV